MRKWNELRRIACAQGILNRADGSVKYSQGSTSVLVAVYGPTRPSRTKFEKNDRATIDVVVCPDVDKAAPKEKEYQKIIRKTFESVVLVEKFPRTVIRIVVQVVRDDGSLLSTMINAICLALMDAGIEMTSLVSSVTCFVDPSSAKARIRLDPSYSENERRTNPISSSSVSSESKIVTDLDCRTASVCIAFSANNREMSPRVLASVTCGKFLSEQYFQCVREAARASSTVVGFYRTKANRHYNPGGG